MTTDHDAPVRAVPPPAMTRFRERFRGQLLEPGQAGYEDGRAIWNGAIDRMPGLIARCSDASDVALAVRLAAEHDLLVSVRSGGHGVGGLAICDDGLVIDLSLMRRIDVDPDGRKARVQAGVLLGELDQAMQPLGLAVPAGIVTHTGVAGLTLGGGIGWLMRRFGLTIDNLLEAEIVLADGSVVTASPDEHGELFWALRGGGGNFGVVTSFLFRAHEVGPGVFAGPLLFPLERAQEVMEFYRGWAHGSPDELTTVLNIRKAPPAPWVPEQLHGFPTLAVVACWCGDIEGGARVLAPLKALGPQLDLCVPRPFLEHQSFFDASAPIGWHYYWKSVEVPEMSPTSSPPSSITPTA